MNDLSVQINELKKHIEATLKTAKNLEKLLCEEKSEATQLEFVTLEQVRSVLAEKSRDGFTEAIRNLLLKYGAQKLSEIDPEKYPLLLADAEALKSG